MTQESFFGQLLIDLTARIESQVKAIQWSDQDLGQLEYYDERPAVKFPCVLIDFPQANYEALAQLTQLGDIVVQIRLGFTPFSGSHSSAPEPVRKKALEYFAIEQKIFEALMGWAPDSPGQDTGFGEGKYTRPFVRVSHVSEHRENDRMGLRVRVLTYSTGYQDESAMPKFKKKEVTLQIEPQTSPLT